MFGNFSIEALWPASWVRQRSKRIVETSAAGAEAGEPADDPVKPCIKAEVSEGERRISERVRELQLMSEQEVFACGNILSTIFNNLNDLIADASRCATNSLARSEEVASNFVHGMQQDIQAQEAIVNQVLNQAKGIEDAITAINDLMQFSKMLAINARIEAARLGRQGQAFAIIADHMRDLSGTIHSVADRVTRSICAVRESVHPVMEHAASMHERTRSFIDVIGEQVKAASRQSDDGSDSGGLNVVRELTNEALAHLQFQDRLSQKLAAINHDYDTIRERVCRMLDGEVDLPPIEEVLQPGDGEPGTGEVLLF